MSPEKAEKDAKKAENKKAVTYISSNADGVYLAFWAFIVTCFKHPLKAPALTLGGLVMLRLALNFTAATSVATIAPASLPKDAPAEHKVGNLFGRTINAAASSVKPALRPDVEGYFTTINGISGVNPNTSEQPVYGAIPISTMGVSASQPVKSSLTKEQEDIINRSFGK